MKRILQITFIFLVALQMGFSQHRPLSPDIESEQIGYLLPEVDVVALKVPVVKCSSVCYATVTATDCFGSFDPDSTDLDRAWIEEAIGAREQDPLSIVFYPNPVQDVLQSRSSAEGQLLVFDNMGRLVHQQTLKPIDAINLTALPAGHYNLKFVAGEKLISKTIIKMGQG